MVGAPDFQKNRAALSKAGLVHASIKCVLMQLVGCGKKCSNGSSSSAAVAFLSTPAKVIW